MKVSFLIPFALVVAAALVNTPEVNAQEKGFIKFTNKAFKEIEVTDKNGKKEHKLVEPKTVLPKDEIVYIISFENTGDKPASNIKITDPIPNNSMYKKDSAFGAGTTIEFSIDGGKTYNRPENLKIKDKTGSESTAGPEDYTNIRWIYTGTLQPGQEGTVTFRTIIE